MGLKKMEEQHLEDISSIDLLKLKESQYGWTDESRKEVFGKLINATCKGMFF